MVFPLHSRQRRALPQARDGARGGAMDGVHTTPEHCILLIGDNRFLIGLVATNLAPLALDAVLVDHNADASLLTRYAYDGAAHCKLLMLALSQSGNEPVVVLARTGLTHLVGAVPLLIISDRLFQADPAQALYHLPFPFRAHTLQQVVSDLLNMPTPSKRAAPKLPAPTIAA